ncbi:histidine kinase,HAMP domain-containing protein,histidine kinase [Desulfitobacterium dichloroeliminans LMG P-21439]|uniref:histidine kinase n=1 Tax=Desulfitobacterium dichloroeliminans (strain LMG P-21439 / DCA1) TaxID=871963 RepID=L0F4A2_DESDL|nr:PAS domain-containing sensor histidine kinase [Desulfitobacterium dichloroeliminans]AGA67885.1 histidine kinase,HAMP domain-containing protein,histidine kinase [Desulfitobacterium dichloroeliminans LMG P-21439]
MKASNNPWWMRIRVHVLLFGVSMSILPVFFLGYLSFTSVKQHLEENIYEQNYQQITMLASEIEERYTNLENTLAQTTEVNARTLLGQDQSVRRIVLGTLMRTEPFIDEIKVANLDFTTIDQVARTETVPKNFPSGEIEHQLKEEESIGSSPIFFFQDGRPAMYLTLKLKDPLTHLPIGYLQAKIDLKKINSRVESTLLDPLEYIYLIDESGNLIGHTDFSLVVQKAKVNNASIQDFFEGQNDSFGSRYKNIQGISVIGSFVSLDNLGWAIFIEQPSSEAFKTIHTLALQLIVIAVLIMVIVLILSIGFGLKLVDPIENVESRVREIISTGNLDNHLPIENWNEIGRLVQSFNQLLNYLDQKNLNLKEEKELLTTVVDGIGAGMILLNSERKIIWWNPKFTEWFGNEIINLSYEEVVTRASEDGAMYENGRNVTLSSHGVTRHLRQMEYKLSPDNPENAAYLLLIEDVTQEVELEARMLKTDKMAAIGLLASGVAHEINNPLAIVAAHSEDLLDRLEEKDPELTEEEITEGYHVVLEQIAHCKKITSNLLGFARKNPTEELVDLKSATLKTLELLAYRARQNNVRLIDELEEDLLVWGNENEWQQVVLNIVTNSLDVSDRDSIIEVRGYREIEKSNLNTMDDYDSTDGEKEVIKIEIKDYGPGISARDQKSIFDPFFTTKSVGKGTGLGLFVCYEIIRKMHGTIEVKSVEGEGTLVTITLFVQKEVA